MGESTVTPVAASASPERSTPSWLNTAASSPRAPSRSASSRSSVAHGPTAVATSLTAAAHDGYIIGLHGGLAAVGGTSASAPSFAGLMGLVVQNAGARQGNANSKFYTLAGKQGAGGALVFHDTTSGNNGVPGLAGYSATVGYDLVTGLGSVDANVLVTHWAEALVAPGFQFSAAASSLSLALGGNASVNVSAAATGGFTSAVSLSVVGLPAGVSAAFTPTSILTSGMSVLKLTAASSAHSGSYPVTAVATGGGLTKTVSLTVSIVVPPTFTLTAQSAMTVPMGQKGSMQLSTARTSTFNAAIGLSVGGLPSGTTASFSPPSIAAPGSGTSTLSLTTQTTAPGNYALVLTGAGGGIAQTMPLSFECSRFHVVGEFDHGVARAQRKGDRYSDHVGFRWI